MPFTANNEHINCHRLRLAIACIFLLSVVVLPLPALSAEVHLESSSDRATAGFFRLSWAPVQIDDADGLEYQLQVSSDAEFSQPGHVYQGPDLARVISGKSDADYYYRIRAIKDSETMTGWSDSIKVTVAHHPLSRAAMFFVAGAIIFVSLLVFIITHHRTQ